MLWPLDGCTSDDPLHGGYGWLDTSADGVTPHPGLDLNAGPTAQSDCDAAVIAPVPMTIVRNIAGYQNGYGNHVWAQADTGEWLHFCHLTMAPVPEGSHLDRGSVFATCGRTNGWPNGWPYCHLHLEIMRQQPSSWEFWPKGYSRAAVASLYLEPSAWLVAQDAQPAPEPEPTPQEVDVTDDERQALQAQIDQLNGLVAELGNQVAALRTEAAHVRDDLLARAVAIGAELSATKRLSAKRYRALAAELSRLAD